MTRKKYKVTGIGNAMVDVLAHVDDEFLEANNLEKGITRLIGEDEAHRLHRMVEIVERKSGGSIANTIAGLAILGNSVSYIGKIRNDQLGNSFEKSMNDCGVSCRAKKADEGISTGLCVVLVTPDAERTMNTYLGIAEYLCPDDVCEETVQSTELMYLEGYIWDRDDAKKAILKAIDISKKSGGKISLSLSDPFCVNRHRAEFFDLAQNHVDILFANEDEITSLFEVNSFDEAVSKCKEFNRIIAVTRGEMGSVIISGNEVLEIPVHNVDEVVDTTGAGDMFAAGFLHGYINGKDLTTCGQYGSRAAAHIVERYGARFDEPIIFQK